MNQTDVIYQELCFIFVTEQVSIQKQNFHFKVRYTYINIHRKQTKSMILHFGTQNKCKF